MVTCRKFITISTWCQSTVGLKKVVCMIMVESKYLDDHSDRSHKLSLNLQSEWSLLSPSCFSAEHDSPEDLRKSTEGSCFRLYH
jgi:hypothetical protein